MTDQSKSEQSIDTLRRSVDADLPPLPEPCGYLDAGKDAIGRDLSDAAWTEGVVTAYATAAVFAERERWSSVLQAVIDTRDAYARASHTAMVAEDNFSGAGLKLARTQFTKSMMALNKAEREARDMLAAIRGEQK
jgi:hypothetical protein